MPVTSHSTRKPESFNPIRLRAARIEIPVSTAVAVDLGDLLLAVMNLASHDRAPADHLERCYNLVRFDWGLSVVKPQFRGRWDR